jgi:hypothetical protein
MTTDAEIREAYEQQVNSHLQESATALERLRTRMSETPSPQ